MPETNTPVAPAETALPPVTDLRSAAAHIEGLLDLTSADDDAPVADATESTPDDGEDIAPETPASDDTTTDDSEPASEEDQPAISAPQSWTAAEKEQFKLLPSTLQATVARREQERDQAISTRMNALSEQRKAIEADTARINQTQQQYHATLNQLLVMTVPELEKASDIPASLAQTDPTEYVRRTAVRDDLVRRVQAMNQEMQRVQGEQQQQYSARYQEHLQHQYQLMVEMIPDFKDPEKTKAIVTDIGQTMQGYGFSIDEIASIADARAIKVIARLAQLEKREAARQSAQGKKTSAPAPRSMPTNAATGREDRQQGKLQEQYARLRKSGSPRDAAAIFEHIL